MRSKPEYIKNEDGSYNVVIPDVQLNEMEQLMIENGYPLDIEFNIIDGRKITVKQRKKIFALLNDIYMHTGQPQGDLRQMFQFYLEMMKGYESISLRDCSVTVARELIEVILEWTFLHDIPLNHKTSDLLKEDAKFIYLTVINRQCIICGKPRSDLAHKQAIGRGRNRNQMNHYGHEVLALCRNHHTEQHDIGITSFNEKYHLQNSWIKVDDRLNKMLKGG